MFLSSLSRTAAAMLTASFMVFSGVVVAADQPASAPTQDLADLFSHPPEAAKPWVYWFWMDGNVTKAGITADLEAMQRIGIGGALMMGVGLQTPPGPADFNSPLWRDLYAHAGREAKRLGLKLSLHQCDGWATAGGQWITPERSMKMLVWTTQEIDGSQSGSIKLKKPLVKEDFYAEVATLAVPLGPKGYPVAVTATVDGKPAPGLMDGNLMKSQALGKQTEVRFATPRPVSSLVFHLSNSTREKGEMTIETAVDGQSFKSVATSNLSPRIEGRDQETLTIVFPSAEVTAIRILCKKSGMMNISELELPTDPRVNLWEVKSGWARQPGHGGETSWLDNAAVPADLAGIDPQAIIDLSAKLAPDGTLTWTPPAGRWLLVRAGMTSTAVNVKPPTQAGSGLEADKMSGEAIRFHFAAFAKGLIAENNTSDEDPISSVHVDSWESGIHTWSTGFQQAFAQRRGYALTPWLPVLTSGLVIGSAQESERFLWDVRRTMADLIRDNFYGEMLRMCHDNGVLFQSEAAGRQMFMYDPIDYNSMTDISIGEFWMKNELRVDCRVAASVAHIYNRPIAAAEAFTAGRGNFSDDPFAFKALGDRAFCTGVNRYIIHRYCMQPFTNVEPGMTFGPFGINFERTQTWWDNGGKAWMAYVTRCQSLLQAGRFVADVIHYIGDDAPNYLGHRDEIWDPIPTGHDYDGCNLDILRKLQVDADGGLILPHGMRYRVLLLPNRAHMSLAAIEKIEELVKNGATVIGPRPQRTPGLTDWRNQDAALQAIAARVWGAIDGKTVTENRYGKGRMISGLPLAKVLASIVPTDFAYVAGEKNAELNYIHRATADADWYFVANADEKLAIDVTARFRVNGKAPELWDAATGTISRPAVYRIVDGITEIPLHFDPAGSVFVVFRKPAEPQAFVAVTRDGHVVYPADPQKPVAGPAMMVNGGMLDVGEAAAGQYQARTAAGQNINFTLTVPSRQDLSGPWTVAFPPGRQAPAQITMAKLISWSEFPDNGVKYYSGSATYTTSFVSPFVNPHTKVVLDLGQVKNVAEVSLNGQALGTLWKPPYTVDITQALKPGNNDLKITVTNLWPNRLIGDAKLHSDPGLDYKNGGVLKTIPEWVKQGGTSPVGRTTFLMRDAYQGDDKLLESGLLGPVRLIETSQVPIP